MNAVGVDVGGTKISAGLVTSGGEILREVRYPSAGSTKLLLDNIVRAVREVREGRDNVRAVCLAVPGFVLAEENKVVFSPNLPSVEGVPLKEALEERFGLPVTVENDGNAAAWGEYRFGAGSGVDHLVFVALGTGVGGGVISHGLLTRGAQGAGGELGHVTIEAAGPRCACGNHGCLEALASGAAITRRAHEKAAENPRSALGRLAAERKLSGEDVTRLAEKGDEAARAVLEETGRWLGIGLAGFVNVFGPEVIAIGGGAARAGEFILARAREEMYRRARSPSRRFVKVKLATLGSKSGVVGAAALARDPASGEYVLGL